ncbi:MAG: cytochrome c oxidase subunit 3 family protein [Deltaproteobacteria bacterium]|nr:cytochrome c oxidase subunit 3 family protein [Deltaproteobacteria bacterium]
MNDMAADVREQADTTGGKLGMWLFIFSEIMFFGMLFLLYAVYRTRHAAAFHAAAQNMDTAIGTLNTAILLTSSLFMALSVHATQEGRKRLTEIFLSITIVLGISFLVIKSFEWLAHFHHGLYPGSVVLSRLGKGEIMFFGLYYVMTGLHGVHVFIGVAVLTIMLVLIHTGKIDKTKFAALENAGLYWHLVDIIWIFLFPLFYLIK